MWWHCDIVGSRMSLHRHVPSESESLYVIWKIECDWSHERALIGWGKSKYKFSSVQERPNRISRVGDQERALIAEASRSRASCTLSSWATISLSPTWDSFCMLNLDAYWRLGTFNRQVCFWNSPLQRPSEVEKGWHTLLGSCQSFPSGLPAKWK